MKTKSTKSKPKGKVKPKSTGGRRDGSCSGGAWNEIKLLKASMCFRIVARNRDEGLRFLEDLISDKFTVTADHGFALISRKEFDLWRGVK